MTYYQPIIDISRYQYPLNLPVMWASGVRLVYIRCTVGDYYTDTRFTQFWDELRAFGFKVGVYHVNTPEYSVASQMDRLFGPLGLSGRIPDVPICLDCELTRGQNKTTITANILGCLADIEELDGRVPSVYTRGSWWNVNVNPSNLFEKYPLFVARYANVAHPWNDAPNLKPHSFPDWVLWQYSADGNLQGENYGVGSTSVDLDKGNGETLAEVIAKLQGEPLPPPDPIGETLMQFKAKYTVNVRSGPNTTYPDIGDLAAGAIIAAYEIQATDNNSVWVRFGDGKWVALVHNGGGPYLEFSPAPPVPVVTLQTTTATNLRWYSEVNGQNKPIMSMPPSGNRPAYTANKTIVAKPGIIDADGVTNYYEVLSGSQAIPPTYVPPAGYTGWFVRADDVFTVS